MSWFLCLMSSVMLVRSVAPSLSHDTHQPRYNFIPEELDCPDVTNIIPEIFYSSYAVPLGAPLRAFCTAPPQVSIRPSSVPGAGLGVFATTFIRRHTWLAEYEGERVAEKDIEDFLHYAWEVTADDEVVFYVDGEDARSSNWLRYINGARHVSEENVSMNQCFERIYYRTNTDIAPGTELFVDYGASYADKLGIDYDLFTDPFYTPRTTAIRREKNDSLRIKEL